MVDPLCCGDEKLLVRRALGGENQEFSDMDAVPMRELL
jgi:5-keto 4-deoxyuronate isomerase